MKKTCIIIAGPTAVGKTALSIDIAKHFNTHIISADSRQCFRELNIGVAKPTDKELASVQHYFINSHSIHQTVSAADFETFALNAIHEIFEKNDVAVMVGGTGLYIKAFLEGLDPIPPTDNMLRQEMTDSYREKGLSWLQNEVKKRDPDFYAQGEIENPQRLLRALEVVTTTGRSITTFQSGNKKKRDFNIIRTALEVPREILYDRINKRTDQMIDSGLVSEAEQLIPFKELNALQTVGYRELFSSFNGEISLDKAIELIKQNSRQYAKRQMTWFRRDPEFRWFNAEDRVKLFEEVVNSF